MERYEYLMVKAPSKRTKFKGLAKADDPFAQTLMDAMNELARDGWQFLRTETMLEDRRSFPFGSSRHLRSYMVYQRALRSNGMSLTEPVAPQRVRNVQPPNLEMLRDRISSVMKEPAPVQALRS